MMEWEEYEALKKRYADAQKAYDEVLSEKLAIFERTQPNAVQYDRDRIMAGGAENALEIYVVQIERIDTRLRIAEDIMEACRTRVRLKEDDLRASTELWDRIYRMRFLDRLRVVKIAEIIHYSEPTIWRILRKIEHQRKVDRK